MSSKIRKISDAKKDSVDKVIAKTVNLKILFLIFLGTVLTLAVWIKAYQPKLFDQYLTQNQKETQNKINDGLKSIDFAQQNPITSNSTQQKRQLSEKSFQLHIPKIVWLYNHQTNSQFPHQSYLSPYRNLYQLNRLNNVQIALKDNYTVQYVSSKNYSEYLSQQNTLTVNKVLKLLESRFQGKQPTQILQQMINETQNVTKRLITYFLIKQHGGIFIDDRVTLIESLNSFLSEIGKNRDTNIGNRFQNFQSNQTGKCIGFYNDKFSSMKQTVDFLIRDYEVEKSVVKFPNLEDYFLACEKDSRYVEEWLKVYVNLLMNEGDSEFLDKTDKSQEMIGMTDTRKIYEHGHFIATHIILQRQQSVLQEKSPNKYLAIDSLSLLTINSRLGPTKLQSQFVLFGQKTIAYLTKITLNQMQLLNGKMKFVFCLEQKVIKLLMEQFLNPENETNFVVRDSFVQSYWFSRLAKQENQVLMQKLSNEGILIKEYKVLNQNYQEIDQKRKNNIFLPPSCPNCHHRLAINESSLKWSSLQRNIWVIWDNGIEKSNFIVEMCFQNLKLSAQNSNFTINLVSKDNVKDFISKDMITKINNAISNASFDLSNQAISDLWRLALVYEHGGVYFDASTFQIDESFEWILNVTQFPRSLIWNRYGDEPNVFMLWNAYYGSPLDWHYDKEQDTRSQWHLSYENNFIAAVKGSELIREWLDVMMEWIQLPFDIVWKEMENVQMTGHSWTYDNKFTDAFRYLTAMDSVKYVIGRKQKLLKQKNSQIKGPKTASHYYKLWSMPGQMIGQQKFRGETNYQNRDYRLDHESTGLNNIYRYKYAFKDVQGPLGPALFQVKFFGYDLIYMNKYINDFYAQSRDQSEDYDLKTLNSAFHPESVLVEKLFTRFPEKAKQNLQKYFEINEVRLRMKAANKIWTY